MANEYWRVMIFLCVYLANIHAIKAEENQSIASNEQSEADYIRLQDLIRQQLLGLIQDDFIVPKNDLYPMSSMSGGTQVRHLGPRSGRLRNFLFGSGNDGTQSVQNGGGDSLNILKRRPPQQNNHISGMNNYYEDDLYPQYIPSQNLMYDYLPTGNQQLIYDGYNGRPNMMWNGGGIPAGYEYVNQPLRVPGRRVGVRPPPIESYNMVGNRGFMPSFDSVGSPGSYIIQVPSRGRRNNINGGLLRPTTSPGSQIISPSSGGLITIPTEVSNVEDSLDTARIPIRNSGRKNNQNQNLDMSMSPGSQIITSGKMGISDSEAFSTDLPSAQSYTITSDGNNSEIPSDISGSGGSLVSSQFPENIGGLRVGNKSPSNTGFSIGSDGIELGGGETYSGLKIGREGSGNNIELPIDSNVQGLVTGGKVDNIRIPSGLSGLRSGLTNNLKLPANLNGIKLRTGGFLDNIDLPSTLSGLRVGSGKSSSNSELPVSAGGVRTAQNQITLPSPESLNVGNGELISTTGVPTDISTLPGSFSVSSGRAVQTSPSSVGEMIQGPTSISIDEADAQPDYDIDIRDLDESAYISNPIEMLAANAKPMADTITQTESGRTSESLDITSPDIVSSVSNLVDQDNESTNLSNDMNLITDARNGRIPGSPTIGEFSQNGPENLVTSGNTNTVNPKRKSMAKPSSYVDAYMDDAENNVEQLKPQMNKFSSRSRTQQPMGYLSSKMGAGNDGITEVQDLDFGQMQNTIKPSGTRMMNLVTAGDGSGTTNVGTTGKSTNGRSRQYKVLVLDGDHELIRGLKLPGMKSDFDDSGEV